MDQAIPRGPGGPSGSAPRKKKKKFSILGFIGKIFLVLFTLCVIGVLTLGMFAKLFMTYINTNLIPSLGEITIEEMAGRAVLSAETRLPAHRYGAPRYSIARIVKFGKVKKSANFALTTGAFQKFFRKYKNEAQKLSKCHMERLLQFSRKGGKIGSSKQSRLPQGGPPPCRRISALISSP